MKGVVAQRTEEEEAGAGEEEEEEAGPSGVAPVPVIDCSRQVRHHQKHVPGEWEDICDEEPYFPCLN